MKSLNLVNEVSVSDYMDNFIKSLNNFCSKSPAQPSIDVVKEQAKIYLYPKYDAENPLIFSVDVTKDKKEQIKRIKDVLEISYPVVYEVKEIPYSAKEVDDMVTNGKALDEAINARKPIMNPLYKIVRVHHSTNELDIYDIKEQYFIKLKAKIPVSSLLDKLYDMDKISLDALKEFTHVVNYFGS